MRNRADWQVRMRLLRTCRFRAPCCLLSSYILIFSSALPHSRCTVLVTCYVPILIKKVSLAGGAETLAPLNQ